VKLKVRNQFFAPTLKAQQYYQLVAKKCFPSRKMAEGQIFIIFLVVGGGFPQVAEIHYKKLYSWRPQLKVRPIDRYQF
jgi:hypothetical protein